MKSEPSSRKKAVEIAEGSKSPQVFGADGFHMLVDAIADPVICISEEGLISYWNRGAESLFGYRIDEAIGKPLTLLMPEKYRPIFEATNIVPNSQESPNSFMVNNRVLPAVRKDGSRIYVELSRSVWKRGEKTFFTGIFRDVTERRKREATLTRRIAYEKAVAETASRLISAMEITEAIRHSLREIGQMCRADRSYLFEFNEQAGVVTNTHEWCAPYVPTIRKKLRDFHFAHFPWSMRRIEKGEMISISDTTDLPPEARPEKVALERLGIRSVLILPILIKGKVVAAIGLDSTTEAYQWPPRTTALLEVCASIIGSALERARTEEQLRASELRYRQLFESAPTSLWQVDYSKIIEHIASLRAAGVSDLREYFDNHPEAVAECAGKLKISDTNQATLDLFKAGSKEDFLNGLGTVFTPEYFKGFKEELIAFGEGNTKFEGENIARTLDGQELHIGVKTFALPGSEETMESVLCAVTDITERKRAEIEASRRIEYERVISNLATRFISSSLDEAVNEILREIGLFSGVNSFLCFFEVSGQSRGCSCTWRTEDSAVNFDFENSWCFNRYPWIMSKLNRGEAVRIDDCSKFADIAGVKKFRGSGAGSILIMPLFNGNQAVGCMGLVSPFNPHKWSEEDLSLLLVSSSIVGNALERQSNDQTLKASEQKYRTLIESAGDAIIIADAKTGLIVDANKEAERLLGRPADEIIGIHQTELHPPEESERYAKIFRKHVEADLRLREDQNLCVIHKKGWKVPVEISVNILDLGGKRIVQGIFHDISDRHRARELRDALHRIISTINSTLQFETIIQRVTVEASKALDVDTSITFLADGEDWVVRVAHGYPQHMVGMSFGKEELAHVALAVHKRRPLAFNDARNDARLNPEIIETFGIRSMLVVPLMVREERIGCLTFCRHLETTPFTDNHIDFASQLATATSFALENARLYAEKRNIADALQQSLLMMPKEIKGVHFGNLYRSATGTARVGGDFYDIFRLPGNLIGLVIGDVSGKGLEAAKLTSLVKNTIRAYAAEGYPPDRVMKKTNDLTIELSGPSTFVTVFFGLLDPTTKELRFCSAGHPPPLVKKAPGRAEFLTANSPAIGILPEFEFSTAREKLSDGDILFLYTDGAIDARRGSELFGDERLRKVVADLKHKTTEELPHLVFAELLEFAGDEMADDLALLAVSLQTDPFENQKPGRESDRA